MAVEILRILLFLGLVFHKLLWEVLKRRTGTSRVRQQSLQLPVRWPIKLVKAVVFVFLAVQTLFLDLLPISDQATTVRIVGAAIYLGGLITALVGRLQLGANWVDLEDYRVLPGQSLVATGVYYYIRHPIYTGDILLLIGLELALNSWLVLGVVIPLFVVIRQALAEEYLLSHKLPGYSDYCTQTKRFIPFLV